MKAIILLAAIMALTACASLPADSTESAATFAAAPPVSATPAVQTANTEAIPAQGTSAESAAALVKPEPDDPKIEKIVTTSKRVEYCDNKPPTGSRIPRGNRCYVPKTKLEREQYEILVRQNLMDRREANEEEQRLRMDCEAMKGHANGATTAATCF